MNTSGARIRASVLAMTMASKAFVACHAQDLKCRNGSSTNQELMARAQIENLMSSFVHIQFLEGDAKLEPLFAMHTEGVSFKDPVGPSTIQGMAARFSKTVPDRVRAAQMNRNSVLSPVIEIAQDGKTAQAAWDSIGMNIRDLNDVGVWLWSKYGADFVKENGQWKIWHLQVYPVFLTSFTESITRSAKERTAQGAKMPPPPPGSSGAKGGTWLYDGVTLPRGPRIPVPYCSFDPANSN